MITKQVEVNGTSFRLILTDQAITQVNNLKNLYSTAYEYQERFEEVSSEISATINEITTAVEPAPSDSDLDGLIQEIIKTVENKEAEVVKQLKEKPSKTSKTIKSKKKLKS